MKVSESLALLLTHPGDVRTLIQFWLWQGEQRDLKDPKHFASTGYDRAPMRRCWELLAMTSRSFVTVIMQLGRFGASGEFAFFFGCLSLFLFCFLFCCLFYVFRVLDEGAGAVRGARACGVRRSGMRAYQAFVGFLARFFWRTAPYLHMPTPALRADGLCFREVCDGAVVCDGLQCGFCGLVRMRRAHVRFWVLNYDQAVYFGMCGRHFHV